MWFKQHLIAKKAPSHELRIYWGKSTLQKGFNLRITDDIDTTALTYLWKRGLSTACLFDGLLVAGRVFRLGDWAPKQRVLDDKLLGWRGRARLWHTEEEHMSALGKKIPHAPEASDWRPTVRLFSLWYFQLFPHKYWSSVIPSLKLWALGRPVTSKCVIVAVAVGLPCWEGSVRFAGMEGVHFWTGERCWTSC